MFQLINFPIYPLSHSQLRCAASRTWDKKDATIPSSILEKVKIESHSDEKKILLQ